MEPSVVVTQDKVEAIGKVKQKHPSMSDLKSIPGFVQKDDGSWSAPASGAWGEAMRPFWRADHERHKNNLGNRAYEERVRFRGRTQMVARDGKLWKRTDEGWTEV